MSRNERPQQTKGETPPRDERERIDRWEGGRLDERVVYENDLPPALPSVEATTIIPAYAELENGNFWRILDDANQQTLDSRRFEIIMVVNNTLSEATQNTKEFIENQKTVAIGHALRTAAESFQNNPRGLKKICAEAFSALTAGGVELSNWQKRVFTEAVRHGTRFFVVDASSSDRAPIVHSWSEDYNIRGVARHIGGRIAYRRSTESVVGDDSVIDFIDADCGMPTSYFKAVSESAQKNRTISAFVKELVTYAPNIPDWPHLDPLHRVAHLFHFLRRNITVRRERYLADSDTNPVGHGPSIAVRAKLFASINGYPRKYLNEDFQLRRSISARGEKFGRIDGTHVRLSDRDAPTSIDGKSAAPGISSEFSDSADSFAHYFDPHNLKTLEGHTEYLSFAKTTLRTDKDYSAHAGYRDLRAKRWKEEVALSKKRVLTLRKTVVALVKVLEKVLVKPRWETYSDPRLLRGWLEKHIGGTVDDYVIDWLVENPVIVASVVNVARMMRDDDQRDTLGIEKQASLTEMVWSFFKKYLPEYFTPLPEDEPDYEVLRASVEEGTMPEGHSLNSITHLVRATSEWRRSRT